jgi:hypothetical protein
MQVGTAAVKLPSEGELYYQFFFFFLLVHNVKPVRRRTHLYWIQSVSVTRNDKIEGIAIIHNLGGSH